MPAGKDIFLFDGLFLSAGKKRDLSQWIVNENPFIHQSGNHFIIILFRTIEKILKMEFFGYDNCSHFTYIFGCSAIKAMVAISNIRFVVRQQKNNYRF